MSRDTLRELRGRAILCGFRTTPVLSGRRQLDHKLVLPDDLRAEVGEVAPDDGLVEHLVRLMPDALRKALGGAGEKHCDLAGIPSVARREELRHVEGVEFGLSDAEQGLGLHIVEVQEIVAALLRPVPLEGVGDVVAALELIEE